MSLPQYINLSAEEKNELLFRASASTKISPILLEKDFWVCWLLDQIFQMKESHNIIFKGGTSLSKSYGLIQRFSEDIDLTINKSIFSEGIIEADLSGKQFARLLESYDEKAIDFIQNSFRKNLEALIRKGLSSQPWSLTQDTSEKKNLRFFYPTVINAADNPYVEQSILLEMGIRGGTNPCEDKTVKSYIAEQFPNILQESRTIIRTLSPIRTFWEKITLLHAENHRPETKELGDRMSRHYYDVYKMIQANITELALKDMDLLDDVIENKKKYFRRAWAQYDSAKPGTLNILPNKALMAYLEADYKKMEQMIFGEIPSFARVIHTIQEFEKSFNSCS